MSQSVHGPTGTGRTWTVADASTTLDARWHVYSIRHDDHELRLSVDGHRVITLQRSAGDRTWVFDKSFDVVLSGTLDVDRISYQPAATR